MNSYEKGYDADKNTTTGVSSWDTLGDEVPFDGLERGRRRSRRGLVCSV